MEATPALFKPITLGKSNLLHRIVMAPLTRCRATPDNIPTDLALEYYIQRASVPGTLIITEGTYIAPQAGGYPCVPGIWSQEQIVAWKKITDAVHAKGSFMYLQLWTLGRAAAHFSHLFTFDIVSSSPIAVSTAPPAAPPPRALTVEEIKEYVGWYAAAAKNAIEAGFDGVEIHSANGYLLDQFLQDVCNERVDEYGGSIENRARFTLEVAEAVTKAVGQDRTGLRISPWSPYGDMRMADPMPQFSYLISTLKEKYPNMAYLHFVEPRLSGDSVVESGNYEDGIVETNASLCALWAPKLCIRAGGFDIQRGIEAADVGNTLVAYGRHFIANPDLPTRLKAGTPLNRYDRATFYTQRGEGYTDYAFEVGEIRA